MTEAELGFTCLKGRVDDKYDVKEELGRGQFAVVKRCVSKEDGEEFAAKYIKVKLTKVSRSGLNRALIEREANILASLNHENIIRLHNVYDIRAEMVLIMELLSGGELFDKISEQDFMTEMDACIYLKQVLQAIDYCHDRQIVHLDIKPENIVLKSKSDTAVKLVDFGLAQVLKKGEQLKEMMGTPEFVAPEIINFEDIGPYTDMWAIGVLTYVLLSGYSPFLGDDNQETYENIVQMDYDFDEDYFDMICDEAKEFISSLLVMDPAERNTSKDCLEHPWLVRMTQSRDRVQSRTVIKTRGFKAFVARRRWKGTFQKLTAISRFAKLLNQNQTSASNIVTEPAEPESDTVNASETSTESVGVEPTEPKIPKIDKDTCELDSTSESSDVNHVVENIENNEVSVARAHIEKKVVLEQGENIENNEASIPEAHIENKIVLVEDETIANNEFSIPEADIENKVVLEQEETIENKEVSIPEADIENKIVLEQDETIENNEVSIPEADIENKVVLEQEETIENNEVSIPEADIENKVVLGQEETIENNEVSIPEADIENNIVLEQEETIENNEVSISKVDIENKVVLEQDETIENKDISILETNIENKSSETMDNFLPETNNENNVVVAAEPTNEDKMIFVTETNTEDIDMQPAASIIEIENIDVKSNKTFIQQTESDIENESTSSHDTNIDNKNVQLFQSTTDRNINLAESLMEKTDSEKTEADEEKSEEHEVEDIDFNREANIEKTDEEFIGPYPLESNKDINDVKVTGTCSEIEANESVKLDIDVELSEPLMESVNDNQSEESFHEMDIEQSELNIEDVPLKQLDTDEQNIILPQPSVPIEEGAKPKSPVDDKTESSSSKNEVDEEPDDQHTSKVEVVLRRPLSTQFGPDPNEEKVEDENPSSQENELDVKISQEDIHFESTIQNVNADITTGNSDILSAPSNIELEESCTSTVEASPETVNDVVSDSDFYVVDVISSADKEKKAIESVEVDENFKEAVVISDITSDEEKLSDDISHDNDELGMHTGENTQGRDSTDLLKEQIFDIISNIDESEEAQKASKVSPAPISVSIDLSTGNTNNTSIESSSLNNTSDNISENNSVNVSVDITLPHISITSDNAEGDEVKHRKLENGEHKVHHRYSREIAVHYTEDLRADLEALEKEEKVTSTNLAVSNEEISNVKSASNDNTVEGDVSGIDSMSHDHTVNASVDTGVALSDSIFAPSVDTDNASSGSIDQTESRNSKRYERSISLNEQRRQFILGENRTNSVDSKPKGDAKQIIDEDTIIPSVQSNQNEEPEELQFPDENGTETQIKSQNENIISDTPDITLEKVESNGPTDVEVSLDLNKNPDDSNVSNDKKDKLANDADIQNGNSEGISEDETKKPNKKKKKEKQTCKCSLM